jgi:hydroxylysine kinase
MSRGDPVGVSSSLMTEPPSISEAGAAVLAEQHFGVSGRAKLLPGERDENFLITSQAGRFVLKVANAAEALEVTRFQTEALAHLERADPAIPVPRVHRTLDGQLNTTAADDSGSVRILRLLSYLEGGLAADVEPSSALRLSIGRTLARLDRALLGFAFPSAPSDLSWDLRHAGRLRSLIKNVEDGLTRARAQAALDQYDASVAPALPSLRNQVIHNDFSLFNVLVGEADPASIIGVIDFGDMIHAPLINEVAIAACYHVGGGEDPLEPLAEIVGAYNEIVPLMPEEADLFCDLVATRLAQTVLITEWRARRYPENSAYILKNHPASAAGLARLADLPREQAQGRIRRACGLDA